MQNIIDIGIEILLKWTVLQIQAHIYYFNSNYIQNGLLIAIEK